VLAGRLDVSRMTVWCWRMRIFAALEGIARLVAGQQAAADLVWNRLLAA
jgi:hypothetical protein